MHAMHEVPLLIKLSATIAMLLGLCDRLVRLYPQSPTSRRRSPSSSRVALPISCSTNGISTSCTTCSSSAPPSRSGGCCGTAATSRRSTGSGPNGSAWLVAGRQPRRRAAPDGISLYLCLRHADRPDRRGHLGDRDDDERLPHPLAHARGPGDRGDRVPVPVGATRARWLALAATLVDLRARRRAVGELRHRRRAVAVRRAAAGRSARFGWALGIDGFALLLIMLSVFLMPICIGASWQRDREARARIYGGVPADRSADDRHLRGAGPVPVLHLLRSRPDPDVPDHRHLGRREPDLRELQVLPLHAARLGADAHRDAVHGADARARRASRR